MVSGQALGFIQAPGDPQLVTAVAYPNFTSNDVTIATALFTFLLPAGTVTLPAIPPAPATGSFTDINGDWDAQLVNAGNFPGNPADLMGFDVYQVVLQNSPSPNTISGQPVPLFSFRLTNDCIGPLPVMVLTNDSPIQFAIFLATGANFNNEMSVSVNNALAVDLYVGNNPASSQLDCPLDDLPTAVDDAIVTTQDNAANVPVLGNDNFGNNGPAAVNPISITSPANNGTAVINNNGTPGDPTDDFIVYTPNLGFTGNDSFVYQICDSDGDCATADVSVVVQAVSLRSTARCTLGHGQRPQMAAK